MSVDDDKDVLAAEYVLGTLDANERAEAQALIAVDAGFAAIVRNWERRLGELNVLVASVEPPPQTFDRIKARIAGAEPAAASQPPAAIPPAAPPLLQAPEAPEAPHQPPPEPPPS